MVKKWKSKNIDQIICVVRSTELWTGIFSSGIMETFCFCIQNIKICWLSIANFFGAYNASTKTLKGKFISNKKPKMENSIHTNIIYGSHHTKNMILVGDQGQATGGVFPDFAARFFPGSRFHFKIFRVTVPGTRPVPNPGQGCDHNIIF